MDNENRIGLKVNVSRLIKLKKNVELLELANGCIHSHVDVKDNVIFAVLFLVLLIRINSSSLEIVELFDCILKKSLAALENELDKFDKTLIGEILINLDQSLDEDNTLNLNSDAVSAFLLQCMKKRCKIEVSSKLLAFTALEKMMRKEEQRDTIVENFLSSICLISGGRSNLRSKFLLVCYEKGWYCMPMKDLFDVLLDQTEEVIIDISLEIKTNVHSLLFTFSFIQFFLQTEKGFNVFLRVYKEIVDFYSNRPKYESYGTLCKKMFDLDSVSDVYKYFTRKAFLFCLEILTKKAHLRRIQVAKALLKMNLKNVISFQKKRLVKTARVLIKSDLDCIFEVGVLILSIHKKDVLVELVDTLIDLNKKKIIFNYLSTTKLEVVYNLYLELLSYESTRDIEYVIEDIPAFSRVFYHFPIKEVCRFLQLDQVKVEDVYTADLALWYSKYFPGRIDEIQLVSFFFDSNEHFLISKNISFYVKLVSILCNLYACLSFSLKRKLVSILKDLLFYSPYTKEVGAFLCKVGCNKFTITNKTDYAVVVLAACNHADFRNIFLECSWTPMKDRALVYILSHQPEYGVNYKWRLLDILQGHDTLSQLDLLRSFSIFAFSEEELADFYFSFIDENQNVFYNLIKSREKSISLQTCLLVYTAIRNKCLLPEKSIPIFLSYTRTIPRDIFQYESVILNNLNLIVKVRDSEFIFILFKRVHSKTAFIANLEFFSSDEAPILFDQLFSQILKFNRRKFEKIVLEKVREFRMASEDESLFNQLF